MSYGFQNGGNHPLLGLHLMTLLSSLLLDSVAVDRLNSPLS
jgi:hypothetical protein